MAKGRKTGGRDFKPGDPGGPGRKRIDHKVRLMLEQAAPDKAKQMIADSSFAACRWVLEQVIGKATETVDLSVSGGVSVKLIVE